MKETKFKQTLVQTKKDSRHCEERSDAAIHGGFKMTEAGLIPSDWEVKTLGSLTDKCSYGVGAEARVYCGDVKYIRITDIDDESHRFSPSPITSPSFFQEKHIVQKNDLLVARTGASVGKSYLYDEKDGKLVYAGFLMKLNVFNADSKYVFYNTLTKSYWNWVASESARTGQPGLNLQQMKLYSIALPPTIKEQQRIANALSDVDTLIANLEKLIAKKKNIKQGAMQQLLTGKKRLPGFAPAKPTYKQTELGKIPTDWEVKKIGEFTKLQAGGTPSTLCDEFWGGNIRWMNSGELNNKRIYDVAGRITELGLNSSSTHLIPSNCVLVGLAGQGKTRGTAAINYVELCTNQSIAAMFPSKTHNSEYLYHNIDSRYEELRDLSSGDGGRGGLNLRILANLFIALPSIEEQTAIANVLSDMDTEIATLETKLAKYRKLKTGMMQQLLTGKIRLV